MVNGKDTYLKFRELINRRNCHIHNNGIVDDSYLRMKDGSVDNFNIYSVELGEYLFIDKKYFSSSFDMCRNFLANFINSDF